MIFPGMDPYLENPWTWQGFHNRFIVYLAEFLQPLIEPRYVADVEQRVFVEGPSRDIIPDIWVARDRLEERASAVAIVEEDAAVEVMVPPLEVHESYVTLLDLLTDQRIVTVIELLSPTNKYAGPGRKSYQTKQEEILASETHLVEIDLLRNGPHVLAVAEWAARSSGRYDYLISVNRAVGDRSKFLLYPRGLRHRLPRVRIPLADGDPDVILDLQAVLARTYEACRYRGRLNYHAPCIPPLSPEDQAWADALIRDVANPET